MIWRLIKGLLRIVVAVVGIVVLSAVVAVSWVEYSCRPDTVAPVAAVAAPPSLPIDDPAYRRTEANTFWTFPEWYIVYSFEDFGGFLESKSESAFPYLGQISGFWRSYCAANRVAAALPGSHYEYKQMIYVIGLSYTFEYLIKGAYENTVGRLTEWLRGPAPTAEDVYARRVVQDYAAFLRQVPWYEYPFMAKLAGLWRDTPLLGDSPIRSVERKIGLSAEYLVKAGYARLIALALATAAPADLEIMFVVNGDVDAVLAAEPEVRLVRHLPDGSALLIAPRYRAFTNLVKRLADRGVEIVEIAGNRRILMTAIVPDGPAPTVVGSRELFLLPLDARPGFSRVGYDLDVTRLSPVLRQYKAAGVEVEQLYDY